MRSWRIILGASGLATTLCAVVLSTEFSWRVASWPLRTEWPLIAVAWLTFYGLAVLTITTTAFWTEIGKAKRDAAAALIEGRDPGSSFGPFNSGQATQPLAQLRQIKRRWTQRYFICLGASQFFTAIIALLGLGVALIEATYLEQLPAPLPAVAVHSLAFTMAVFLGATGLIFSAMAVVRTQSFAGRVLQVLVINAGFGLLRQISAVLGAPPNVVATNSQRDAGESIEEGQRVILKAIKDVAISINRLVRRPDAETALLLASEKLMAITNTLDTSLVKLNELAAPVPIAPPLSGHNQLSAELHDLLREIDPSVSSGAQKAELSDGSSVA